jgi:hypothetical protein
MLPGSESVIGPQFNIYRTSGKPSSIHASEALQSANISYAHDSCLVRVQINQLKPSPQLPQIQSEFSRFIANFLA